MAYAIYGTGGFGREVAPLVQDHWLHHKARTGEGGNDDIVLVDDAGTTLNCNGRPVIDFTTLCQKDHRHRIVVVAIGNGKVRERLESKCLAAGLSLGTCFASTSRIMDDVEIGDGSLICDFAMITSNVRIGKSFQANIYSYVAHDCVIGDYVTFAPRVNCNGNVHIGNHVYIGTGAMLIQGTHEAPLVIGDHAVIGMGAVVTKSVLPGAVVVGNPGRSIRTIGADASPVSLQAEV